MVLKKCNRNQIQKNENAREILKMGNATKTVWEPLHFDPIYNKKASSQQEYVWRRINNFLSPIFDWHLLCIFVDLIFMTYIKRFQYWLKSSPTKIWNRFVKKLAFIIHIIVKFDIFRSSKMVNIIYLKRCLNNP